MKIELKQDWLADTYSHSKLMAISKCMRYAYNTYVVKTPAPRPEYFVRGSAVHVGQEYDDRERIAGRPTTQSQVLDCAVQAYKDNIGDDSVAGPINIDQFADEHSAQLDQYWSSGLRSALSPVPDTIEAYFKLHLSITPDPARVAPRPTTIQGFVDRVAEAAPQCPLANPNGSDACRRVVDYKVVGKSISNKGLSHNLQGNLYALGSEVPDFQFLNFIKKGVHTRPKVTISNVAHISQPSIDYTLAWISSTVSSFREALKTGDFPRCDPTSWQCTGCTYRDRCYPTTNADLCKYIVINSVEPVGTVETPQWRNKKK